jgi:hypothetical protein
MHFFATFLKRVPVRDPRSATLHGARPRSATLHGARVASTLLAVLALAGILGAGASRFWEMLDRLGSYWG